MNTVTVVGNLTRDPELRFSGSGTPVASLAIAVNRVWTDPTSQERQEKTSFLDISCWGSLAENVSTSLQKGSRVVVYGRLEMESWEDQQGANRSKIKIVAEEVCPSLRWATAQISKNPRPADAAGHPGGDTQQSAPAPAAAAAPADIPF